MGMPTKIEVLPETGFKVGKDHFKKLHLQIHLHTQTKIDIDSLIEHSGFRVYYINESRKYSIGNVQVGQEDFEISPLTSEIKVEGSCSSGCTRELFKQSGISKIFLTRIYLHMHGLGTKVELVNRFKDEVTGKMTEKILAQNLDYEYERPGVYELSEPIAINSGMK